ncbi:MAG: transglutaminase domain-containing protein, partial [Anaerolineaceae bacterium]
ASIEKETIQNVLRYTQEIAAAFDTDFDDMLFGGTEKQILDRGTDWCSDMARVGAVLLQCLGIPCRMLYLANPGKAYNGHVVNEAFYEGRYGVVDFIYGYQFYDRTPKSAFEIQRNPEILAAYPESYQGLFSAIAISEYDPCTPGNNYSISRPNDYYLKLIHTDHENMWLMGEDLVN